MNRNQKRCKRTSFSITFLHSIKVSGYRTEMQLDYSALVVKQNNYAIKIVNAHIVHDSDS